MGYNLLINGVYWGYNLLASLLVGLLAFLGDMLNFQGGNIWKTRGVKKQSSHRFGWNQRHVACHPLCHAELWVPAGFHQAPMRPMFDVCQYPEPNTYWIGKKMSEILWGSRWKTVIYHHGTKWKITFQKFQGNGFACGTVSNRPF